ncbi:c-type cytochrome [Pontibaca methylaminivorans]|uniref:c-type cytochrome n=1 Tax=Pontibaca methylaminivorans TaxID=515897 RepID=UPI002FDA2073
MMRLVLLPLLLVATCRQDMVDQASNRTYSESAVWDDHASARPFNEGTVARGDLERQRQRDRPPPVDAALLERGRERYDIFCAPCHGLTGRGDGRVVQRGFPAPPDYLSARLRAAPARHFVDVIANGYGVMFPYGARVAPRDRWAITAYIRALQLAGNETTPGHPGRAAVPVESEGAP